MTIALRLITALVATVLFAGSAAAMNARRTPPEADVPKAARAANDRAYAAFTEYQQMTATVGGIQDLYAMAIAEEELAKRQGSDPARMKTIKHSMKAMDVWARRLHVERKQKLEEALAQALTASSAAPRFAAAHFNCAVALNEYDRRAEAISHLKQAVALLGPEDEAAQAWLEQLESGAEK